MEHNKLLRTKDEEGLLRKQLEAALAQEVSLLKELARQTGSKIVTRRYHAGATSKTATEGQQLFS